jgi:hypothetical protein
MKALIAKETLLTYPDFSKKYIRMPANYNLEFVSPKTVSQLPSILVNYTISPNKIYNYRK